MCLCSPSYSYTPEPVVTTSSIGIQVGEGSAHYQRSRNRLRQMFEQAAERVSDWPDDVISPFVTALTMLEDISRLQRSPIAPDSPETNSAETHDSGHLSVSGDTDPDVNDITDPVIDNISEEDHEMNILWDCRVKQSP